VKSARGLTVKRTVKLAQVSRASLTGSMRTKNPDMELRDAIQGARFCFANRFRLCARVVLSVDRFSAIGAYLFAAGGK